MVRKISLRETALFWIVILCLFGCGSSEPGGAAKATFQLPWPDASGGYSIQKVELETLSEPQTLMGSIATLRVKPRLTKSGLVGGKANVSFIEDGDVLVATDAASAQLATVYAHLEKLKNLDVKTGLTGVISWPRSVGIEAKAKTPGENKELVNNAAYDSRSDSLIVVPYEAEELPITMNAGIIAHEHFHAVFHALVKSKIQEVQTSQLDTFELDSEDQEEPDYVSINRYVIRGMDEGLADFWAWVYTGDDDFISHSLPDHSARRRLDGNIVKNLSVKSVFLDSNSENNKGSLLSKSYRIGTNYARFLRGIASKLNMDSDFESRIEVANTVTAMLPELSASFLEFDFSGELLELDHLIKIYLKVNQKWLEENQ